MSDLQPSAAGGVSLALRAELRGGLADRRRRLPTPVRAASCPVQPSLRLLPTVRSRGVRRAPRVHSTTKETVPRKRKSLSAPQSASHKLALASSLFRRTRAAADPSCYSMPCSRARPPLAFKSPDALPSRSCERWSSDSPLRRQWERGRMSAASTRLSWCTARRSELSEATANS